MDIETQCSNRHINSPERYIITIVYRLEDENGIMPYSKDEGILRFGYLNPTEFAMGKFVKYFKKYAIYEYVVYVKEGNIKDGVVKFLLTEALSKERVY